MTSLESPSPAAGGGDARAHIDALNARAWVERRTHPQRALELAEEALRLSSGEDYAPGLAASLRTRGACLFLKSEVDAAERDLQAALDLFRAAGDRGGEATALRWLGHVRARGGDSVGALRLRTEALQIEREIGDRAAEADTLLAMGLDYQQLGEYAEALRHGQAARRIKEALGDALGVAHALNNLGNAHYMLGEYEQALEHYQRSLEIHQATGAATLGAMLNNIGSTYRALGRPHDAVESFSRAVEDLRACGDRSGEACALANLGEMRHQLGQHAEAMELFETALASLRQVGDRPGEVGVLVHLGEALATRGERARAVRHLEDAVRIGVEIGARQDVVRANRTLAHIHEEMGNVLEAFRCYKAYRELESEIFGQEADQKIRAVFVRAEVETALHQAEQLRRRNEELERQTREDALTGVFNRRYLDAVLAAEVERARFGRELTVAMVDVDCFKQVNDRFSHAVGDQVLRKLASILRQGVRPGDVVARYGGEEFVLLLADLPLDRAAVLCDRLRKTVRGFDWSAIQPGLRVTLSAGLASARGVAGPDALLAAADARLYEAKRAGRDRVAWGAPSAVPSQERLRACS